MNKIIVNGDAIEVYDDDLELVDVFFKSGLIHSVYENKYGNYFRIDDIGEKYALVEMPSGELRSIQLKELLDLIINEIYTKIKK